jgi:N-acetylmuramoyl-L-alanine amidase
MVSVVVEPAFISNSKQRKEITDAGYQGKIAEQITGALRAFLEDQ